MRPLYLIAAAGFAATATSASATITLEKSSLSQGTLVHNPGNSADVTASTVVADLGEHGPQIVNFDATTSTNNELRLQKGTGQSDLTGAKISGNNFANILSGDIYLTGHAGMSWIELGLTPVHTGTIDFTLTDNHGNIFNFDDVAIGPGNTHFGFLASAGETITNLFFEMNPLITGAQNGITDIKQVRITQAGAVPEPATWAMMLAGFGAMGLSLRRSRKKVRPQLA